MENNGVEALTIVDYGVGNLKSLRNALSFLGVGYEISSDPDFVAGAGKVILPGVGAFGYAMDCMVERGLADAIRLHAAEGRPILGICLGMQLLFSHSDEGDGQAGLDLIPGKVRRFVGDLKVPHMGWNEVEICADSSLLKNPPQSRFAYFVHSYFCEPADPASVAGKTDYGREFCSVVSCGAIHGAQFHPEKSQEFGLRLLKNFAEI